MMLQASPPDAENFPFMVLGNKVDIDNGCSRVVYISMLDHLLFFFLYKFASRFTISICYCRFLRRKLELGVQVKETYLILRPLPKKT